MGDMNTNNTAESESSFGYFRNDGKEFVITERDLPRPWMNYSWNQNFIAGVNHLASGQGAYKERPLQYVDDRGRSLIVRNENRCFYLRDTANGNIWSPAAFPAAAELDNYRCVCGLGYSYFHSVRDGIAVDMRWFVPSDNPCEIWTITVRNNRANPAKLQWFSFVDLALRGYPVYCDYYSSLKGEYDSESGVVVGINRSPDRTHNWFSAFIGSDRQPEGFDTSRRTFVGTYGNVAQPQAVKAGGCRGSLASNEKLAGASEHQLNIPAGGSRDFNVFIGGCDGVQTARKIVKELSDPDVVRNKFEELCDRKTRMASKLTVETPDKKVNYLVNNWLKQQIQIYADVGSDNGRGFRDAMQLLWATSSYDHDYTRTMLEECLRHQYANGHTLRGWLPVDDHHYSDGPVWIPPVIDAYIRETGEEAILDRVVPFFDEGEGTIWNHALRGLRHLCSDLGPRGLVRCHFGDWNDSLTGIDRKGRGESVWTTMGTVYSLKVMARVARRIRQNESVTRELLQNAQTLSDRIKEVAWDGEWFIRAINDSGERIGSRKNDEGRIWLLPQVWAVMAGIVEGREAQQLLKSLDGPLKTPYGYKTLTPAYTQPREDVGRVTQIAPGMWENATPYCHANGFKVFADCIAGRGNSAFWTYSRVMPDNADNPSTHSGCEPYAFTNQYIGPDNRRSGETQFAWMTGAGGWFYRAMTEAILGVRADYDGLRVAPCLPSHWEQCVLVRDFRGARYDITLKNPDRLEGGEVKLKVDGEYVEGKHVDVFPEGTEHAVEATIID